MERRDAAFNRAFTVALVSTASAAVWAHGVVACAVPFAWAVGGSVVKLLCAYRLSGEMRASQRALDYGTALFHVCFGVAIRGLARL